LPTRLNLDAIKVWMLPQVSERGFGKTTDGISLIVWIFRVQAEVRLDPQQLGQLTVARNPNHDPRRHCVVVLDDILFHTAPISFSLIVWFAAS
jgi:hypothetical protein